MIRLVVGSSARAVSIGLVIGVACALAAGRVLRSYLFGVSPFDPIAYWGVALLIAAASITATLLPARRAVRVDPMTALRCE